MGSVNSDFRAVLDVHLQAIRWLLEGRMKRTYEDLEYTMDMLDTLSTIADNQELEEYVP